MTESLAFTTLEWASRNMGEQIESIEIVQRLGALHTGARVLIGMTEIGRPVVVKFSGYAWGPKREWKGLQAAYNSGLLVPTPLALISDADGHMGIVSRKVEGVPLQAVGSGELRRQLGRQVRAMHESVLIGGQEWLHTGKADFTHYDRSLHAWGQAWYEALGGDRRSLDLLGHLALAARDSVIRSAPVFIHNDIHDYQAIVTPDGKLYLIDFEYWRENNPLVDIAVYLLHGLRTNQPREAFTSFASGYVNGGHFSEEERMLIAFFLLFEATKAVDYFARNRRRALEVVFRQLHTVVDYIDSATLWDDVP